MMFQVTHNPAGTAYATASQVTGNITIDGKTGTAQNGVNSTGLEQRRVHLLRAGHGRQSDPIAVGVMVQGGGYGADAAAARSRGDQGIHGGAR